MTSRGSTLFDTAIGRCGIAWGARGVTAVRLPERDDDTTRARLPEGHPPADPPPEVRDAIAGMRALLRGEPRDLADIVLDLDGVPEFHQRVYAVARTIPPGRTLTYGDVARRLGMPGAARAVGHALGRNPCAIVVPCHRVLAAGGASGGFSAHGGIHTKWRMLTIENAPEAPQPTLF
ncbi:methylated-DNA--[protein]-cysteine S-methyltransferase [Yinghuangia sp. ASG 101]|uniref:methylated-DNA--[protein]-cysteine S-methyltransferase n=1 Tax=Yinghuangia sp. ASG 101 TaxID=2896848 RepID=UPI001E2B0372|nr:methylated-DNA--[protein]-cysteine S-methyltransferase [Yinghuangia sp. ASG 101]UGQ13036.1 methylated-DNA--[protein]-cysteine S-methyltransferase [Yinghuangia sp. ASG 101]